LLKHSEISKKQNQKANAASSLFEEADTIYLCITLKKVPEKAKTKGIRM
jgi:hypothetical protein